MPKNPTLPRPPAAVNPQRNRPGITEVKEAAKQDRPGIVQVELPDPPPVEAAKPPEVKEKQPPHHCTERAPIAEVPLHGGRIARIGDQVSYWMRNQTGKIVEYPGRLVWWDSNKQKWAVTVDMVGRTVGRHDIPFSEVPMDCHWSWRDGALKSNETMATDIEELKRLVEANRVMDDGMVQTIETLISNLGKDLLAVRAELKTALEEIAKLREELGSPVKSAA